MATHTFNNSREAEAAFYEAFHRADLDAMMAVWADEEAIECVHPTGPRLQGRAAVYESWAQIFNGSAGVDLQVTEPNILETGELALHIVHERLTVPGEAEARGPIIATNAYRLTEHGWRMVLHHASPAPRPAETPTGGGVVH